MKVKLNHSGGDVPIGQIVTLPFAFMGCKGWHVAYRLK